MRAGKRVTTSLGELIVLDVQEEYLVLLNEEDGKFIKANTYYYSGNKVVWNEGEYYSRLNDLIESVNMSNPTKIREREERRKRLSEALAINSLGGSEPTEFAKELFEEYVNGEIAVEEAVNILTKKYKIEPISK